MISDPGIDGTETHTDLLRDMAAMDQNVDPNSHGQVTAYSILQSNMTSNDANQVHQAYANMMKGSNTKNQKQAASVSSAAKHQTAQDSGFGYGTQ